MNKINTLGIVGLGGIGASVGMAAKQRGVVVRALGVDIEPKAAQAAIAARVVDEAGDQLSLLQSADCVLIASPPQTIPVILSQLYRILSPATVITDVGSVKAEIVQFAQNTVGAAAFVGGHPIAGTERSGIQAARPDLFMNAPWILTPTDRTDPHSLAVVENFVIALGAKPVMMSAEDHDRHIGLLSHLPNLLAAALIRLSARLENPKLGGGSWRDLTRVAGSEPALWSQIVLMNRKNLMVWIDALIEDLQVAREGLVKEGSEELCDYWNRARSLKEQMDS